MIEAIGANSNNGAAMRHWTYVLDDYERALNSSEAAIEAGFRPSIQPPSFVPPAGVTPLPAEMRHRAQSLVDRTQVLLEQAQKVSVAERLSDPSRSRRILNVAPASTTSIDIRA